MTWALLAGASAAAAVLLAAPARPRRLPAHPRPAPTPGPATRRRLVPVLLACAAGPTLLPGAAGVAVGVLLGVGCWVLLARAEPGSVARERERARRGLPHLVLLVGAGLRAGTTPERAVRLAADALGGPAAERLAPALARLEVGVPADRVWSGLAGDGVLGALGRTLARAHTDGIPVADAVARLAVDLGDAARAGTEDRARAVGVRAALPLGLCLLPAFLLVGVVPVVAGLLAGLVGG